MRTNQFLSICITIICALGLVSARPVKHINGPDYEEIHSLDKHWALESLSLKRKSYPYCAADEFPTFSPVPNATLVHVQSVFRHGDRSPQYPLTTDYDEMKWDDCSSFEEVVSHSTSDAGDRQEFRSKVVTTLPSADGQKSVYSQTWWKGSCISGQLTNTGAKQTFHLGEQLRNWYTNPSLGFLDVCQDDAQKMPLSNSLYLRSSDVWRTRESLQQVVRGFLSGQESSCYRNMPTLNITTYPFEVETMFPNFKACPLLIKRVNEFKAQWAVKYGNAGTPENKMLTYLQKTSKTYGADWANSFERFFDSYAGRVCHGVETLNPATQLRELQGYGNRELIEIYTTNYSNASVKGTENNIAMAIGPFIHDLDFAMTKAINSYSTRSPYAKMRFYGAHDSTLTALWFAFNPNLAANKNDFDWPPYAASMLFEVWKRSVEGDFLVRIIYNGQTFNTMTMANFTNIVKPLVIDDILGACKIPS